MRTLEELVFVSCTKYFSHLGKDIFSNKFNSHSELFTDNTITLHSYNTETFVEINNCLWLIDSFYIDEDYEEIVIHQDIIYKARFVPNTHLTVEVI
jgi:hypothetical protein